MAEKDIGPAGMWSFAVIEQTPDPQEIRMPEGTSLMRGIVAIIAVINLLMLGLETTIIPALIRDTAMARAGSKP